MIGSLGTSEAQSAPFAHRCIVHFRTLDRRQHTARLSEVSDLAIDELDAIRYGPRYPRQRNRPGLYLFSTSGRLVYHESLLERDSLMLLDFDPDVVSAVAQPLWMRLPGGGRRIIEHLPDFIVRLRSGTLRLIDVSPRDRADEPERQRAFRLTRRACRDIGWEYEVMTELDAQMRDNLDFLRANQGTPSDLDVFAPILIEACASAPQTFETLSALGPRDSIRPVIFHLLWRRELAVDLDQPFKEFSEVTLAAPRS